MKRQILFLITLTLALTPACRKPLFQKPIPHKDSELIAGSVFTGLGGAAGVTTIVGCSVGVGVNMATLGLAVAGLVCAPIAAAFLIIGIPLLVVGVKKKKKQQMLEKIKQEQQAREESSEISEEIQEYTPMDEFSLKRIES